MVGLTTNALRPLILGPIAGAFAATCLSGTPDGLVDPGGAATLIRNVHLITMTDAGTLHGMSVVVDEGVIEAVVPEADADRYQDATVIDSGGGYLMPGLIDAHVHHREQVDYGNYIAHGVTTVLGLGEGDSLAGMLAVKEAIYRGEAVGPHIYTRMRTEIAERMAEGE